MNKASAETSPAVPRSVSHAVRHVVDRRAPDPSKNKRVDGSFIKTGVDSPLNYTSKSMPGDDSPSIPFTILNRTAANTDGMGRGT